MRRDTPDENMTRNRKLLAVIEGDPARDERRYQALLRLLAEHEAERQKPGKLDS